jgi:hypothetical protein
MMSGESLAPAVEPTPAPSVGGASVPGSTSPVPRTPMKARRWFLPVVAIVVAAVLIVSVLAVASYLAPGQGPSSTEPYATFDEALSVAGPAASHAMFGSWSAVVAASLRLGSSVSLPTGNLSELTNVSSTCGLTPLPGLPASITVDATPPSALPGHAAFWLIGLSAGSGTLLFVSVDLGIPTPLLTLNATACLGSALALSPFPSNQVDSPALVGDANATGGAAFLAQYPDAIQLLAGVGGVSYDGVGISIPWEVADTSCSFASLTGTNVTGAVYTASVTAVGDVTNHSTASVDCSATGGISIPPIPSLDATLSGLGLSKAI